MINVAKKIITVSSSVDAFHDNARSTWLTFFEKSIGAILTKNRMKL